MLEKSKFCKKKSISPKIPQKVEIPANFDMSSIGKQKKKHLFFGIFTENQVF